MVSNGCCMDGRTGHVNRRRSPSSMQPLRSGSRQGPRPWAKNQSPRRTDSRDAPPRRPRCCYHDAAAGGGRSSQRQQCCRHRPVTVRTAVLVRVHPLGRRNDPADQRRARRPGGAGDGRTRDAALELTSGPDPLSQRSAAEVLGVSEATVNRDVAVTNVTPDDEAERAAVTNVTPPPPLPTGRYRCIVTPARGQIAGRRGASSRAWRSVVGGIATAVAIPAASRVVRRAGARG